MFLARITLLRQRTSALQLRRTMSSSSGNKIFFGPFEVTKQVFHTTPHSFAVVNIKPLLPGHVLVCPLRPHKRLTDLSPAELTDLMTTTQLVQRMLARHFFSSGQQQQQQEQEQQGRPETAPPPEAGSFNIALQDGPHAGQTVPHVHVHVLPRIPGETGKEDPGPTDEIYTRMAREDGNVGGALWDLARGEARPEAGGAFPRIEDAERKARSMEEMVAEADLFREVLREMGVGREP